MLQALLVVSCVCATLGGVTVPDKSDQPGDPLSEAEHFHGHEHNKKYDHDAFLGQDQAKEFDQLTPEESKRRLGVIVDRIDENKDGFVSMVELKDWIRYTQKRYIEEDVETNWIQHNPNNEESISWETYRKDVFGFMDEMAESELDTANSGGFSYKNILRRSRRRWNHADNDGNDRLNRTEFSGFLHPEENPLMRDIIILESLEDMDKDNDGKISIDEYIADMHEINENIDEEPDWVKEERLQFSLIRDTNGDGYMDAEEMRMWIAPPEFDHADAEAHHLMHESDSNKDDLLTKDEILTKYDLFVGSQATDFGQILTRHDEF